MKAYNRTSGKYLASDVEAADTVFKRMKGLLGRDSLSAGEALWIKPCKSVHTIGMRFPIDLVFLDRDLKVVGLRKSVPPNRFSPYVFRAIGVLELPAGTIAESGTESDDTIDLS